MLLPGNPHGPTPRLILIALAEDCSPAAVFKAGNTEEARRMVHREYEFLRSAPAGIFHLPAVRDLIEEKDWTAFSMEFVHGNSPGWPASDREIESVLTSWIDTTATVRLADTRPWKELAQNLGSGIPGWFPEFGETRIHPCLFHGDFAPWNVRIDATGRWSVIDWERGERQGVPGWDWLHFDIQSALLLKRPNPTTLIDLLRQTVFSPSFQNYLRVSRLPGREELLVLSYLLYCEKVFRPHGLIEAIRELRHLIETTNPFPSRHVEAGTV